LRKGVSLALVPWLFVRGIAALPTCVELHPSGGPRVDGFFRLRTRLVPLFRHCPRSEDPSSFLVFDPPFLGECVAGSFGQKPL